tara:strand:+ start:7906 stop:11193 length:3288 start_codon:yes stop_codon:yes gene_type:complete
MDISYNLEDMFTNVFKDIVSVIDENNPFNKKEGFEGNEENQGNNFNNELNNIVNIENSDNTLEKKKEIIEDFLDPSKSGYDFAFYLQYPNEIKEINSILARIIALLKIQKIPTNIYDNLIHILNELIPYYGVNNNDSGVKISRIRNVIKNIKTSLYEYEREFNVIADLNAPVLEIERIIIIIDVIEMLFVMNDINNIQDNNPYNFSSYFELLDPPSTKYYLRYITFNISDSLDDIIRIANRMADNDDFTTMTVIDGEGEKERNLRDIEKQLSVHFSTNNNTVLNNVYGKYGNNQDEDNNGGFLYFWARHNISVYFQKKVIEFRLNNIIILNNYYTTISTQPDDQKNIYIIEQIKEQKNNYTNNINNLSDEFNNLKEKYINNSNIDPHLQDICNGINNFMNKETNSNSLNFFINFPDAISNGSNICSLLLSTGSNAFEYRGIYYDDGSTLLIGIENITKYSDNQYENLIQKTLNYLYLFNSIFLYGFYRITQSNVYCTQSELANNQKKLMNIKDEITENLGMVVNNIESNELTELLQETPETKSPDEILTGFYSTDNIQEEEGFTNMREGLQDTNRNITSHYGILGVNSSYYDLLDQESTTDPNITINEFLESAYNLASCNPTPNKPYYRVSSLNCGNVSQISGDKYNNPPYDLETEPRTRIEFDCNEKDANGEYTGNDKFKCNLIFMKLENNGKIIISDDDGKIYYTWNPNISQKDLDYIMPGVFNNDINTSDFNLSTLKCGNELKNQEFLLSDNGTYKLLNENGKLTLQYKVSPCLNIKDEEDGIDNIYGLKQEDETKSSIGIYYNENVNIKNIGKAGHIDLNGQLQLYSEPEYIDNYINIGSYGISSNSMTGLPTYDEQLLSSDNGQYIYNTSDETKCKEHCNNTPEPCGGFFLKDDQCYLLTDKAFPNGLRKRNENSKMFVRMKGNKNLDSSCKKPQDITMNLLENLDEKETTIMSNKMFDAYKNSNSINEESRSFDEKCGLLEANKLYYDEYIKAKILLDKARDNLFVELNNLTEQQKQTLNEYNLNVNEMQNNIKVQDETQQSLFKKIHDINSIEVSNDEIEKNMNEITHDMIVYSILTVGFLGATFALM